MLLDDAAVLPVQITVGCLRQMYGSVLSVSKLREWLGPLRDACETAGRVALLDALQFADPDGLLEDEVRASMAATHAADVGAFFELALRGIEDAARSEAAAGATIYRGFAEYVRESGGAPDAVLGVNGADAFLGFYGEMVEPSGDPGRVRDALLALMGDATAEDIWTSVVSAATRAVETLGEGGD